MKKQAQTMNIPKLQLKKKKKNTGCKKQHQQQQQTLHKTCIFHSSLLQSSFGLLSFFLLTSASFLSEQTNSTETLGGEEKKKNRPGGRQPAPPVGSLCIRRKTLVIVKGTSRPSISTAEERAQEHTRATPRLRLWRETNLAHTHMQSQGKGGGWRALWMFCTSALGELRGMWDRGQQAK